MTTPPRTETRQEIVPIQTTDATVTTIWSHTLPDNCVAMVDATVVGRSTGIAYTNAITLTVNIPGPETAYSATLNEDLDAAETGVDVSAASTFENSDIIKIDSELMKVTGGAGTTTLTVIRGVGGSSAATHTNGATINQASTAFTYTSAADEAAVGDTVRIDSEYMAVTAEDTVNNILTVTRATASSTIAAHAAAAAVLRAGDSVGYRSVMTAKRNDTGAQVSTTTALATHEDTALSTAALTLDVSSNDVRVRVTGIASTTINWLANVTMTLLQPDGTS